MKNVPIKVQITIWYLLLMTIMAGLILSFLILISGSVSSQTAMEQLSQTVRSNLRQVDLVDGALQLGEEFRFYEDGVYCLIYSQSEALLAGQVPVAFQTEEPFQNGLTRLVQVSGDQYYVLDFWLPLEWEEGVWIRGILEASQYPRALTNLLYIALVAMPIFILMTAVGGYWIARRAFRPLEQITTTAAAISQASDLTARVEIPPGKNEFGRLAQTFNQMIERLERSFEAETQFTADASHELRTPVSVIKSACEYAEKYEDSPEEHLSTIAMIHRQADKMSLLISRLLDITRLDLGSQKLKRESVDFSEMIALICEEQDSGGRDISLSADISPGVIVDGDPFLLSRAAVNLLENARKYGREGGHIRVRLAQDGAEAVLTVEDDGIGIAPENLEKIWQRFYQADPSRGEQSGLGLGLSMVRQIAELHGGSAEAESELGKGSRFTVRLPGPADRRPS